jgi:tetratricopeptide (TPR) repeat protein
VTSAPLNDALQKAIEEAGEHLRAGRVKQAKEIAGLLMSGPAGGRAANLLGAIAQRRGDLVLAAQKFAEAARIEPGLAMAHANAGLVLRALGRRGEAVDSLERALALDPSPATRTALGLTLYELERFAEAEACYRRVLEQEPDNAQALGNLGLALGKQKKFDEAIERLRQASAIMPDDARGHFNLGQALRAASHGEEAIASLRRAIELQPDHGEAHRSLSHALWGLGRFGEGWDEYEWRWRKVDSVPGRPAFQQPPWDGTPIRSGRLLLWGEQGIGDEIFFAGLVPEMAATARCLLECEARLVALFQRSFPGVEIVARSDPPDPRTLAADIVAQVPTGSLPRWRRRRLEDFPARAGYLVPDPVWVEAFKKSYGGGGRATVGISWYTSVLSQHGAERGIALDRWGKLLTVPGLSFVNLQYGDRAAEIAEVEAWLGMSILHDAGVDPLKDMDVFAAQVAAMDLIVSIDNSTAHMAGALGRPVWTMVPSDTDCRWMLEREDSPWYPSMRLFRQVGPGDWDSVLDRVAAGLRSFAPSP